MEAEQNIRYLSEINLLVDPRFPIERSLADSNTWEAHVEFLLDKFIKPGDVCLDVGANMGVHSLSMATKVGPNGRVLCFEPSNLTYPRLERNAALNPDLLPRLKLLKIGLSDRPGTMRVHADPNNWGNACLVKAPQEQPTSPDNCQVFTIDSLELDRIDLVKLDVEGMERKVLAGSVSMLLAHQPHIIFESIVREHYISVMEFLRTLGYYFFNVSYDSRLVANDWLGYSYPKEKMVELSSSDTLAIHRSKIRSHLEYHKWPTVVEFELNEIGAVKSFQIAVIPLDSGEFWIGLELEGYLYQSIVPRTIQTVSFDHLHTTSNLSAVTANIQKDFRHPILAKCVLADGNILTPRAHVLSSSSCFDFEIRPDN